MGRNRQRRGGEEDEDGMRGRRKEGEECQRRRGVRGRGG